MDFELFITEYRERCKRNPKIKQSAEFLFEMSESIDALHDKFSPCFPEYDGYRFMFDNLCSYFLHETYELFKEVIGYEQTKK